MKNGMTVPPKIKIRITMKKWSDVAQMCLTLCDPMDYSLSGSSVHGIFQTRIPEWVAISFSRRSSRSRDWTWVSHIIGRRFTVWAPYDPTILGIQLSLGVHRVSSGTIWIPKALDAWVSLYLQSVSVESTSCRWCRKSAYKWTSTVQTHVVQESSVYPK